MKCFRRHPKKGPPGQAGGPTNNAICDDQDSRYLNKNPEKNQAISAIASLRREFIAEALRIVAIKAAHAADDVDLGDDIGAERGIAITISHLKAAAATFREMQAGGSQ
jgi:hypothetical protein